MTTPAPTTSTSARSLTASTTEYLVAEVVRHYRRASNTLHPSHTASHTSPSSPPLQSQRELDKLRTIGEHVGKALAERLSTEKKGPLTSQLEVVKWICKDFWNAVFQKSVDNLKTNHKGTYLLRDTSFRWTKRVSQNVYGGVERIPGSAVCTEYLVLPEAMVKGALRAFGIEASVQAETSTLGAQVDFTIVVSPTGDGES